MKTKTLIKLLQDADPSGEEEVCVQNVDILSVHVEPAYYDGRLQVLERKPDTDYYDVIGAKYRSDGIKVVITPLSITSAICEDTTLKVDYSGLLTEDSRNRAKESHDNLRVWHKNMENSLEEEWFVSWTKEKAELLTEDLEDVEDIAKTAFKENGLSASSPFPEGTTHFSMRPMSSEEKNSGTRCLQ